MGGGRKSTMISARVPTPLVERVDYVTRNTEGGATDRSTAVREALQQWLPEQEREIGERLGASQKKVRQVAT